MSLFKNLNKRFIKEVISSSSYGICERTESNVWIKIFIELKSVVRWFAEEQSLCWVLILMPRPRCPAAVWCQWTRQSRLRSWQRGSGDASRDAPFAGSIFRRGRNGMAFPRCGSARDFWEHGPSWRSADSART